MASILLARRQVLIATEKALQLQPSRVICQRFQYSISIFTYSDEMEVVRPPST